MAAQKPDDAAVSLVLDGKIGGREVSPETLPARAAADLVIEFVGLLEDLADELGVGKSQLTGLTIEKGSWGVAATTHFREYSKVLEDGVRKTLAPRSPADTARSAPSPRQQRIQKRARNIRRAVLAFGPGVRLATQLGRRRRRLPLVLDLEASPSMEMMSARVVFQGMHALEEGSRATFIGVLDQATYSLAASAEHEARLLKLYRGELEISAEVHVASDSTYRGKLLDIEELEEGEGRGLEAWQRWFASTGWAKMTLDEAEKELGLGE